MNKLIQKLITKCSKFKMINKLITLQVLMIKKLIMKILIIIKLITLQILMKTMNLKMNYNQVLFQVNLKLEKRHLNNILITILKI